MKVRGMSLPRAFAKMFAAHAAEFARTSPVVFGEGVSESYSADPRSSQQAPNTRDFLSQPQTNFRKPFAVIR